MENDDLKGPVDENILKWITGEEDKPKEIRKLGEDFAEKMTWYTGFIILKQLSRIKDLFSSLKKLDEHLFSPDKIDKLITDSLSPVDGETPPNLYGYHSKIAQEIDAITEFARKFALQNKDLLKTSEQFYEAVLYKRLMSIPTDVLQDWLSLFNIIERKGSNLLKEIVEKYK